MQKGYRKAISFGNPISLLFSHYRTLDNTPISVEFIPQISKLATSAGFALKNNMGSFIIGGGSHP